MQRAHDAICATPAERGYTGEYLRNRTAVLAASDGWCAWCHGRPATTVDHVVPLAKGGTNDPDNLVAACKPCNYSRGSRNAPSAGGANCQRKGTCRRGRAGCLPPVRLDRRQ